MCHTVSMLCAALLGCTPADRDCLGALLLTGADTRACLFRHHIRLAETVAALARKDERFEVSAPPRFGLVCFRLQVRGRRAYPLL